MARWEVHLALWDALVIEGDTAWTSTRNKATDAKKKKKEVQQQQKNKKQKYTH